MSILFIYSCLPLGGIETFIVRMSKYFSLKGIRVSILFFSDNFSTDLYSDLSLYADIYHWRDFVYLPKVCDKLPVLLRLLLPIKLDKIKKKLLNDITHIHAPDVNAILFSYRLLSLLETSKIILTTGIYHINEFNLSKCNNVYFGRVLNSIIQTIPKENIIFFNEISASVYSTKFQRDFFSSVISPIGVDIEKYKGVYSGLQNNRIVSIGRLAKWKKYNYHMIEVIQNLNARGIYLEYHCYGDGEEKDNLVNIVRSLGLEKQFFFLGNIAYDDFKRKIDNSLLFIGAGTALIEAAACGVPALIGIENDELAGTFGFLHETEGFSYQESELNLTKKDISVYILNLLGMTESEYWEECKKSRLRATDFSMDTTFVNFTTMLRHSYYWHIPSILLLVYILSLCSHFVIRKITNTYSASFFKRL